MSWVDDLASVFRNTPMHVEVDHYEKSGCILNFESLPGNSIVIDVDFLADNDPVIRAVFGTDTRCDVAIFNASDGGATVVLIEATTARRASRKMREAIDQIANSFRHLEQIFDDCKIPIPELTRYAVVASRRVNPIFINNPAAQQERDQFEKTFDAEVRYVRCGRDIWQAIQGETLTP